MGRGDGEGAETGCAGDGEGGWRMAPGSWLGGGGYKVMASPEERTTRGGAGLCRGVCACVEFITHMGHPSWKTYWVTAQVSL